MISVTKGTRIPSVNETITTLNNYNSKMPQYVDFDKIMMYLVDMQKKIADVSYELFNVIGTPSGTSARSNMSFWIMNNADVSAFTRTAKGELSLDADSITGAIDSGKLNDFQLDVIKLYREYSDCTKTRSTLASLLQNPMSELPSCDGHRMLELRPIWVAQNTGRVGMQKPAIQNFTRTIQDIVTVPRGYIYVHCDSGQVEPRIVYSHYIPDPQIQALIRLYDDAYFGLLHYVTMPQSVRDSGTLDFEKMEITDEMQAGRKKIKTYGNAVMYGSTANPEHDPIKDKMIKCIGQHPLRVAWVNSLRDKIERGATVFNTVFGTPIDTSRSQKLTADGMSVRSSGNDWYGAEDYNISEKVKLAINNPIQGTAADLMRLSVQEAHRCISINAKDSYIINYVHDAGSFCISENDWDKVGDTLKDIVAYNVDEWLPIKADADVTRNHGKSGMFEDWY